MNLHLELQERIEEEFGERLSAFPELKQDALIFSLDNGVMVEIRYAGPAAYALAWVWNGAMLGIDTAPVHPHLSTFPNHLHDAEGALRADPITCPDSDPWDNIRALIGALIERPLLVAPPDQARGESA